MEYASGRIKKSAHDIIVPIKLKMKSIRERPGYGETSLLNGGHSTIDLQECYYVPTIALSVLEGNSTKL